MVTKKEAAEIFKIAHVLDKFEKSLGQTRKFLKPQTFQKIKTQLKKVHQNLSKKLEAG